MAEKKMKILPMLIYLGVGVAGLLSLYQLATSPNYGLLMSNAAAYLLAIGGIAWGSLKFLKLDLVETVGEYTF